MHRQHARTGPFGYSARSLVAFALAAALLGAGAATPVLAQQNRPVAQRSVDAPRDNPASAGEAGARPTRPQNENSLRLPADSTTEHAGSYEFVAGRLSAIERTDEPPPAVAKKPPGKKPRPPA